MNRTLAGTVAFSVLMTLLFAGARANDSTHPADNAGGDVKVLPSIPGLPNPLTNSSGEKITTPGQWPARREQIQRIIETNFTGHAPPAPGNVTGKVIKTEVFPGGAGVFQLVQLRFGPDQKLQMEIAEFIPAGPGPFPTIIFPSFSATPGGTATVEKPVKPDDAVKEFLPLLSRGYALVTYNYQQAGRDNRQNQTSGFFPAYPGYDWSTLRAWAWGISRCVDYLQNQQWVNKTQLIATGHSRLGKAVLIAGALDDRIALTAPVGSGCGGTAAFRFTGKGRGGKEGLDQITHNFPYWFVGRLAEFAGQVDKLPFDQHWLIAMVAPRALLSEDGSEDPNVNVNGAVQSYLGAKPVYQLLGVPDRLGIHFRPGGHAFNAEDWQVVLDFADQTLGGKSMNRRFDEIPTIHSSTP